MEQRKINRLIQFSALIPLIYIVYIFLFYLFTTLMEGHFPSYGNPDPKKYSILYFAEIILMPTVPISFVFWTVLVIYGLFITKEKLIQKHFLFGLLSFSLIFLLVKFDPMGILNWLAD